MKDCEGLRKQPRILSEELKLFENTPDGIDIKTLKGLEQVEQFETMGKTEIETWRTKGKFNKVFNLVNSYRDVWKRLAIHD